MKAEKLLINLLSQIANLPDSEYEKLTTITESEDFISLSERQVRFWLEWEAEDKAA